MTTRPAPKLPAQPTGGYLAYLGKRKFYEQAFGESRLRLENRAASAGGGGVLLVRLEAKSRVRAMPQRKRSRP